MKKYKMKSQNLETDKLYHFITESGCINVEVVDDKIVMKPCSVAGVDNIWNTHRSVNGRFVKVVVSGRELTPKDVS